MTREPTDPARLRKEAILADVLAAQRERRAARGRRRRGLAAISLVLGAALVASAWRARPAPDAGRIAADLEAPRMPAPGPRSVVEPAASRGAVEIELIRAAPVRVVQRIGDDELLRALAGMGRSVGLARFEGETRLTGDVTDPF